MERVLIVHGLGGLPNGGWRPWLMGELAGEGIYACALSMPKPTAPVSKEWVKEIHRCVARRVRGDRIYLVGHSLGVPAILRSLETTSQTIEGVVLVSGPLFPTSKKKVASFLNKPFDFKKIKSYVRQVAVIHGDNDRAVPIEQGEALAKAFGVKLHVIKNGGHLNGSSGWLSLPQALAALKKMMKNPRP